MIKWFNGKCKYKQLNAVFSAWSSENTKPAYVGLQIRFTNHKTCTQWKFSKLAGCWTRPNGPLTGGAGLPRFYNNQALDKEVMLLFNPFVKINT